MRRTPQEGKEKTERKNILIRKKKKNILDTHRPSHGRSYAAVANSLRRWPEQRRMRKSNM
jgi:hypothetical protein